MEKITPFNSADLAFYVLPGNPSPGFKDWALYNSAYEHYRQVWDRIFTRRAGEGVFDNYAFFRQSFVFVIVRDNDIIAELCGSFLHLDAAILDGLSYFANFKGEAAELLRTMNAKTLLSLEFSSINPKYSPRKVNQLCFGEIISYLGTMWAFAVGVDATTGLPRRVTGTNDKVVNSGYRRIEAGKARLGLSVDVVLCFRGDLIPHPDLVTRNLIERLWRDKINLTHHTIQSKNPVFKEEYHDSGATL